MLITLFLIATATFFLLEAVPGDPLTERASKLSPTVKENLYKRYGLDKPMMERYVITMKGICKGEFGESVVYAGQTVPVSYTHLDVYKRQGIEKRKGTVVFPHARETPDHQLFHDALAGVFRVGADAGDKTDGIADTVDIHVQRINREL